MWEKRTDLALEAKELWKESAAKETKLLGVEAREYQREGCTVSRVRILDERGVEALHKPIGTYVTIELSGLSRGDTTIFTRTVNAVVAELAPLLPPVVRTALVVGLGNRDITPDAIGPLTLEHVMVTRHLIERMPELFGSLTPVAALSPGVLGSTGMESADIIRGVVDKLRPDVIIMIDALASRKLSRVCATIQLADTGIVPGSGVGNARAALNRETLGVPVVALGIPTVVDVGTLCADVLAAAGGPIPDADALAPFGGDMIVTPKDIDQHITDISRVVGYAINVALHKGIDIQDVMNFLG